MKRDFRLQLPEVDPQALLDDEQARERYETAVRDAVRNESGWEVLSDAVLGQFSFQKLAMYDDYGRHATEIAEHEHCHRIAGGDSTPPPFAVAIPSPARFDAEVHPSKLHTILPWDSSQLEAILAIKSGASLVLDGPPGTGKSQTIANVIAECLGWVARLGPLLKLRRATRCCGVQKKPGHPASLIVVEEKRCRPLLGEWIVCYHQLRHGAIL